MSARKWPIYTMPVGHVFLVVKPPKRFVETVSRYGLASGKVFRTKRRGIGREVRRVA